MRLLDTTTIKLHEFQGARIPDYAILSHTWDKDEVSYEVISKPEARELAGYKKIKGCCDLAARQGWEYVWIDTCCIDKRSSAELSEAINSMWRWYEKAQICFAYLQDFEFDPDESLCATKNMARFQTCRWFTRGWTLQELLAPRRVTFYDSSWRFIGDREVWKVVMESITGISQLHLQQPKKATIAAKMSWMSRRQTTRPEDIAYSLLGLFEVYMPLLYGEGHNAFIRLQHEIVKSSNDETIFAWKDVRLIESGMFALSPAAFADSSDVIMYEHHGIRESPYSVTNYGLAIEVAWKVVQNAQTKTNNPYFARMPLACTRLHQRKPLTVCLGTKGESYVRIDVGRLGSLEGPLPGRLGKKLIYIKSSYHHISTFPSRAPPLLELRWNDTFEENLEYNGLLSSDQLTETMTRNGIKYTNSSGKGNVITFIQSPKSRFLGDRNSTPQLILKWNFERSGSNLATTLFVKTKGDTLRGLEGIQNQTQHYDLQLGGEITVPLWSDLHLRTDVGKESSGEGSFFIDMKLIISTRKTIFVGASKLLKN